MAKRKSPEDGSSSAADSEDSNTNLSSSDEAEGAEALLGLCARKEKRRRKKHKHAPKEADNDEENANVKNDNAPNGYRLGLEPLLQGNDKVMVKPPHQPAMPRLKLPGGALHVGIAYHIFHRQRLELLKKLPSQSARRYAKEFLLPLSLDPTFEGRLLRAHVNNMKK
mmetsp:Transcript_3227/g.7831  ORF Transcript_3227/g.7831 Transcript_3227/m.7831 type:complete len:167 (+) Transcript_3227:48-548(+)|eukprot:CAMPEP_0177674402 /NCGR_PEP_ID=MMETSP0447-20121125/26532_1 /TAXON_ID=0 /ORGANISM="Stygamoeba regulata, Strain BSH-02190019" /LENGTH=166 /DNA_ID=CAMNT_0019182487 /DNA_START=96 /DNA_END=596 /DNA_ORIENTATION=+